MGECVDEGYVMRIMGALELLSAGKPGALGETVTCNVCLVEVGEIHETGLLRSGSFRLCPSLG